MLKFALIQFLPTHFLSTYLRTPVNMKQTCYQSSCIFKAALFIMKWEKPHKAATFLQKDFSRIPSCLEQLLPSYNYFLEDAFAEKSHFFLIVLRNQLHRIYTWKDYTWTNIHSFKYSMVRSYLEIPQSFIFEKSKQLINLNTGCVLNVSFWELGGSFIIFKQASENSP